MPVFTIRQTVPLAPDALYNQLLNAEKRPGIIPDLKDCSPITPQVGSTWTETHYVEEDEVIWNLTLTDLQPNELVAYEGRATGIHTTTRITLKPDSDGTRIEWHQETRFQGFFPLLIGWFVHRSQRAKISYCLQGITA